MEVKGQKEYHDAMQKVRSFNIPTWNAISTFVATLWRKLEAAEEGFDNVSLQLDQMEAERDRLKNENAKLRAHAK
jgi:hypothetical protein